MILLAHAGHWYHAILYVLPIVLIGAGLWWSGRREQREREARAAARRGEADPPADLRP